MPRITDDRVAETTTSIGTGALALAGAIPGYKTFGSVMAIADTCYYSIEAIDANGAAAGEWETGLGTYSAAGTLTRTTVSRSSSANAAVNFAAGTKRVWLAFIKVAFDQLYSRPVTVFFTGKPVMDEILLMWLPAIGETVTFADDFAGSVGRCITVPTATFTLAVKKNGVQIGTVSIAVSGTVSFVTSGAGPESFVGGTDYMTIEAPPTPDATCANVAITLKGSN